MLGAVEPRCKLPGAVAIGRLGGREGVGVTLPWPLVRLVPLSGACRGWAREGRSCRWVCAPGRSGSCARSCWPSLGDSLGVWGVVLVGPLVRLVSSPRS